MRISKNQIRARTRDLPITFSAERISSHGGLELVRRFFDLIDLRSRVRDGMRGLGRDGDYGFTRTLLAVIGLLIVGGTRLTHLAFLGMDPVFLRSAPTAGGSHGGRVAQGVHADGAGGA